MLINYRNTYLGTKVRFDASDMVLHIDSDNIYLVAAKACSKIAEYFCCSVKYEKNTKLTPKSNGPVHIK